MHSRRVLIIDANETHRQLLHLLTQRMGLVPSVVPTESEAIAALQANAAAYSIVLIDMGLPHSREGQRLLAQIRSIRQATGGHYAIIVVTAYAMEEDKRRTLALGSDDYISKPFLAREFTQTVSRWVGKTDEEEKRAS